MSRQEGVPSNDAEEDRTGTVPTAVAEAESVDVAERSSYPSRRREVEVRGNGAEPVTEPSGGK